MIRGRLATRVDLEKLTNDDFRLNGEFRVRNEPSKNWQITPEFKREGTDAYVPFDLLFSQDRFHKCYELIVQTPDRSEVVGSGYLYQSQKTGDVFFGVRSGIAGQGRAYEDVSTVWFCLLDSSYKPTVTGAVELIFVKVSPWHEERDAQRQRVLYH